MPHIVDERIGRPSALWVKDEGNHVGPLGDHGISNPLNETGRERIVSIFGPGFTEELPRAATSNVRVLNNNVSNSNLISQNRV